MLNKFLTQGETAEQQLTHTASINLQELLFIHNNDIILRIT